MVLGRNDATATLLLADGPKLNVAATTVDPVDVVRTTVASERASVLAARTGVVRTKVFEDICFTMYGPSCDLVRC